MESRSDDLKGYTLRAFDGSAAKRPTEVKTGKEPTMSRAGWR
jgi:hypothetical protein